MKLLVESAIGMIVVNTTYHWGNNHSGNFAYAEYYHTKLKSRIDCMLLTKSVEGIWSISSFNSAYKPVERLVYGKDDRSKEGIVRRFCERYSFPIYVGGGNQYGSIAQQSSFIVKIASHIGMYTGRGVYATPPDGYVWIGGAVIKYL